MIFAETKPGSACGRIWACAVSPSAWAQASVASMSRESCSGESSVSPFASAAIITARCEADLLGITWSVPDRGLGETVLFM